MKIIIAGPGCPRCEETKRRVLYTSLGMNLAVDIEHIYDLKKTRELGVMMTPAILIDEKVVTQGEIPTIQELKLAILKERMERQN